MTYISAAQSEDRRQVNVWERDEAGKRVTKSYPAPYYFYVEDKKGLDKDLYGKPLKRINFPSAREFYDTKKEYKADGINLYESDIQPHYKVLSEKYYGKPVGKLNFTFFDIEVDYDPARGFSSPEDPYAPVSAVSIYHHHSNRMLVFAVLPNNDKWTAKDVPEDLHALAEIYICKNEKQLLERFLDEIEDSDIISGWNSSGFDVPYLYMRMKKYHNEHMANRLSFPDAPKPKTKEVEVFKGSMQLQLDIFGRVHIDYLEAFKKFEQVTRPSFTLEAISEEILPELKKLEYEGTLYSLYYDNFPHFMRYNVRDTEVLKGFEEKLGYMEVAILHYHSSTALMNDCLGTVKIVEAAFINECHYELNARVPDSKEPDYANMDDKFAGALVLDPIVGMHHWVFSVDVNSLYPSAIRTLNASPEMIIGQFHTDYLAFDEIYGKTDKRITLLLDDGTSETYMAKEWPAILKARKWCISGYGTVFNQEIKGFIPKILEQWYSDRKVFKAKKSEAKKKAAQYPKGSPENVKYEQEAAYYDRVQTIKKLLLNSTYGCLGNKFFKFYDIRLAESTTRSGRAALMHMVKTVALHLDGEYTYPSPSCIYSDTDSCYAIAPVDNIDDAYKLAKIIEKKVNNSFPVFAEEAFFCVGDFRYLIKAELDTIADRSIFVKKKYYIMHLLYSDGMPAEKMKVMGLQIKTTKIPKPIGKKLTGFIEDHLKGRAWKEIAKEVVAYKEELITQQLMNIGLPKGIKGVEDYTMRYNAKEPGLRLPGHVAAAMFYNKCLEVYGDKESPRIVSGMKIKTYYLTKKFDYFKSIALPTDLKNPPEWFTKHFASLIDREGQLHRLVDKPLQSILSAIGEYAPTPRTIIIDETFEY